MACISLMVNVCVCACVCVALQRLIVECYGGGGKFAFRYARSRDNEQLENVLKRKSCKKANGFRTILPEENVRRV